MKKNTFIKYLLSLLLLSGVVLSSSNEANAQCTGTLVTSYAVPTVVGTTVTTACTGLGEAITITGLVPGNVYQFDNCNFGTFDSELTLWDVGQITFLDFNDDFCGVQSSIVYIPTSNVDVELVLTEFGCVATPGICSEIDITLVSGPIATPANDMPCNAAALMLNTNYLFSNSGATLDVNEDVYVTPTLGSCLTGWCDTGIESSIWFTFVAPASGFVEINACNVGTNFDTQLALYTATNCNDYTTFSFIAANDDGTGCTGFASNLAVACLTPGDTYYLMVDGYSGDTGTIELAIIPQTVPGVSVTTLATAPDCPGGMGMATAVGTGIAPLTYSWSNNATTNMISALPGTFTVSVTDGCGNTSASQTVTIPGVTALVGSAGADQQICQGSSVSIGGNAATGGNPFDGNVTGYGYESFSGGMSKFSIADPNGMTAIGTALNLDLFAGDFGQSNGFYALDYTNQTLILIDTVTGLPTTIGSSIPSGIQSWTGLAWNSTNNMFYGVSTDITASDLYSINPTTGASTLIGTTGMPGAIWLAINAQGNAYSMDITTDMLYSVNLSTGAATAIGSVGFDANFAQDADFDPVTGVLYLAAYNNLTSLGELRTADLTTGITTYIGDLLLAGLGTEVTAFGINHLAGAPYTYQWTPATGLSNANILNPTASPSTTTTYTLTVTDECGTTATDAVTVTVSPSPSVNLGADVSTCTTNPIMLDAGNAGSTYLWCNGATTQTVSATTSGTYCVMVTNGAGCSDTDTVLVQFNTPPVANAGADASVCAGASTNLTATATGGGTNYTYTWSNSVNGASQTVIPTTTTTYTVTVNDNNGCTDTDDVMVSVNASPTANAGNDASVCAGGSTTLTGSGTSGTVPYTYSWSNGTSGVSQTVTPTTTTTYVLTVSDANSCTGTDNVIVTVNEKPTANAGTDVSICQGASTALSGSASGGTGPYTFSWSNGVSGANQNVSPVTNTTYTLTSIDMNGCSNTDNVVVTVNAAPPTPTFTVNTTTGVLASSAGTGNQWYLNGNVIAGATGSNYTATQNGSYHVCVTNAAGCTTCATPQNVTLTSIGVGNFVVPVTIRPNPIKDYLQIVADEKVKSTDYTVKVYNAIGQLMYENVMTTQMLEIQTQEWANGVYTITFIKDGNFAGASKVVKN